MSLVKFFAKQSIITENFGVQFNTSAILHTFNKFYY